VDSKVGCLIDEDLGKEETAWTGRYLYPSMDLQQLTLAIDALGIVGQYYTVPTMTSQ
jgi:hypothetical protein